MLWQQRGSSPMCISVLGLALTMGLGFAGCANLPSLLPTETQLVAARAMPETAPCDAIRRGRALAVTQCVGCHRFFFPYEYPPNAWPALIHDMGNKALLTRRQVGDVTRYMVAASRATRCETEPSDQESFSSDPDAVRRGQSLAATNCIGCHRLYRPQEYAPNAWPRIVRSMAGLVVLPENEIRDIMSYYVTAARQGK